MYYPYFSVGPVNTTIGWTYSNLTCHPSVFIIQGYADRDDIPDNPSLNLTSTSSVLTFPTNITNGSLYWRLLAHDVAGTPCAQESALVCTNGKIYNIIITVHTYMASQTNAATAPVHISPSSDGVGVCVPIPVGPRRDYSSSGGGVARGNVTLLGDFATAHHLRGNTVSSLDASLPHHATQITPLQSAMAQSALLSSVPLQPAYQCISHCRSPVPIVGCVIRPVLTSFIIEIGELFE